MMNWSAFTKKQQIMIVATVVIVLVQLMLMVHFLGWTKPAAERGGAVRQELLDLEQKINEAKIILKNDEISRRELAQSIEKLRALAEYAPKLSDRYAWAYEYISRCSTDARVKVDSLEEISFLGAADEAAADQPYEISISTRCGYNNLVEFLWRLEKDNPLLRVKEVTVSAAGGQPLFHPVRIVLQWPAQIKIEEGAQ